VLLKLLAQQRHHVYRLGHVQRWQRGPQAMGLAHVVTRTGTRLHIAACRQARIGFHHRVASDTLFRGGITYRAQAGAHGDSTLLDRLLNALRQGHHLALGNRYILFQAHVHPLVSPRFMGTVYVSAPKLYP